jgi:GNAT superfamily N-acetyltransferase
MDKIQTDASDRALVTAIRANMCDFFRHLGVSFPEGHFENEKFTRWRAPIPHPWFNGVLSSQLPEEGDDSFIEETIHYFRAQQVGMFTWWMEPHVNCSDWEPVLSRYGFTALTETPGLAVELQSLNEPARVVDGLQVRLVEEEELVHSWGATFTRGYGMPTEWEPAIHDIALKLGWDFPVRNYLGYWNGEPVATSSLFFGAGVAGIYNVSTLPKARGQGIGAALTLRPLQEARDMGYRIGILQSSAMGFNVYRQLGFRHLCQIEYFQLALP